MRRRLTFGLKLCFLAKHFVISLRKNSASPPPSPPPPPPLRAAGGSGINGIHITEIRKEALLTYRWKRRHL